jgi:hypothetical protein
MQFFGRISYSLYLVHELVIFWPENDLVKELADGQGWNFKLAVFVAWLIFTPVLILFSWILTVLVDEPFKDFAYEIDIVWRKKKPPVKTGGRSGVVGVPEPPKPEEDDEEFGKFIKNSWKFFGLIMYFLGIYITTESYDIYSNKESDINYNTDQSA